MKERKLFINEFAIKIMAMLFMTLDHIGLFLQYYVGGDSVNNVAHAFRCAGRLALPLFMFMVAEGMIHSKNKFKYLQRIGIMMLAIAAAIIFIVYVPFMQKLTGGVSVSFISNPFIDLFVAAAFLFCLSLPKTKKLYAIIPFAFAALSHGINVYEANTNYTITWLPLCFRDGTGLYGFGIAAAFYYAPNIVSFFGKKYTSTLNIDFESWKESNSFKAMKNTFGCFFYFALTALLWGLSYLPLNVAGQTMSMGLMTYGLLSIIPLIFYSGNRGPDGKAFRIITYLYYPAHIILLFLIFCIK